MNQIAYEEFSKVDLRIGLILSAEHIPKSEKLLILKVDLGEENPRQIVAGIGKAFEPADLINKKAMFVVNLASVKLMGVESHGMICAVATGEGNGLALLQPIVHVGALKSEESIKPGAKIG